uniref:RING-type E3 ubiquitin transferase n=1 Tax=Tetraodon nigroviridis TaxID=99883 RepID=H3CVR1_TETNG
RRELETKNESSRSGLAEGRIRSGLAPSLYQSHRATSTYAQGARPKETIARDSSRNHLTASSTWQGSSLGGDSSGRASARFSHGSPHLRPPPDQQRSYHTSPVIPRSLPPRTSSHYAADTALPPRPGPEGGESDGTRSTRRLLSRLFSRRSSQDSSSGSSVRSLDDDGAAAGGRSAASDQGSGTSYREPGARASEATFGRTERAGLQESHPGGYRSGSTQAGPASRREPGATTSSWLSSSLRERCSPLLSRLRRHARDESQRSSGSSSPDDEEEEEKEEGAVGLGAFGNGGSPRLGDEVRPDVAAESSPRRRVGVCGNTAFPRSLFGGAEKQTDEQEETDASSNNQEKLRRIKERLLLEDSDEDEGDMCRICQMGEDSASNPLIQPCRCTGSLQYVHQDCIKRWLCSKISSATNLEAITTCELCKEKLHLNIDNFDIQELYRTHVQSSQSEYDEFISSGLYLVVLLHFCEQRFSDVLGAVDGAGLFNVLRILHEHMDNLESMFLLF